MTSFVLAILLSGPLSFGSGQGVCPPDNASASSRVDAYLTHPNFSDHRATLGIDGPSPTQARLLNDTSDLAMCQRLAQRFGVSGTHPNWHWTAYKMGNYYLVSWWYVNTGGGIRIGRTPWLIVDENVTDIARFAS